MTRARSMPGGGSAFAPRDWLALGAALVLLHAAVTFHNVWPTGWVTLRFELSIEVAVLSLALALYSELWRPPGRVAITLLAVAVLGLCIGRYADVTAPALYGRPVNLYWDARHLPRVAAMLVDAASPLVATGAALGVIALLAAAFAALRWSLGRLRLGVSHARSRRALIAVSSGMIALYALEQSSLPWRTAGWFSLPVTPVYAEQLAFVLDAWSASRSHRSASASEQLPASNLERLAGADVVFMLVESYGAVAWDSPAISKQQAPVREALAATLERTGRNAVSALVESPTFGGGSWLAHLSFLSGVPVRDETAYNLLLTQPRETLADRFTARGYRAVALMPGLKREWPEGAFYDFAEIYGARALGYAGPDFGWWRIPDQYALAKLDRLELGAGPRPPVFAFFPTISTHAPFRPTPPYQSHWERMLTDRPYDAEDIARSLARGPEWSDLSRAYAETLAYTFRSVTGYLAARPHADLVLVLIGDHQPPAGVSGEGARWDVPVHVIARNGEIFHGLLEAGFVPGLAPRNAPVASMSELTAILLRSFGSAPAMTSTGIELRVDVAGTGAVVEPADERADAARIQPAFR